MKETDFEKTGFNLTEIICGAVAANASDLHLAGGCAPLIRVDGQLRPLCNSVVASEKLREGLLNLIDEEGRAALQSERSLDFALELKSCPNVRLRANFSWSRGELAAAFRFIPTAVPAFSSLGLPEELLRLSSRRRGLLLITGAAGSGKSTTLAALLAEQARLRTIHAVTLEDPIEYIYGSPADLKNSLIHQREIGSDCPDFLAGIRAALRCDIDVLVVGEMRDAQTISAALTAAETGRLVMATLHTQDAPQSVDRIVDSFPPEAQRQVRTQLSQTLLGICCQQLAPKIEGGRCVAVEMLINTPAVANTLREGRTEQIKSLIQTGARDGMLTMEQSLAALVRTKKISRAAALERAFSAADMRRCLGERI